MKSVAREYERDVYKKTNDLDKDGEPIMAHVGTEIVRMAQCSDDKHSEISPSTAFTGVNEHGWIFKCPGNGAGPHYFTATPAK